MRILTLRSVAIAALILSPALAAAQGGPGQGPGGERAGPGGEGPRGGGARQGEMRREGGERRDGMKGADQRRDREGGGERDRMGGDERRDGRDRGDERRDRGDRGEERRELRGDRDREMRRDRDVREDRDVRIERDRIGGGDRRVQVGRLRPEIRERFRTSVRGLGGERVRGADFDVGVGRVVPGRYHFNRLPPSLVEIAPEYRDFDYLLVGDSILIIDPVTREIVDVLS